VIAIVSILAALLLPALSQAKAKAQRIACMNNLKQWTLALFFYTDNNEDTLPREKPCADQSPWPFSCHTWDAAAAPTNYKVWYNALPPLIGKPALAEYAANPSRRMHFYSRESLFHCPRARFPANWDAIPMFSLAINAKLMRGSVDMGKISCILDPARTVLFFDIGLPGETPVNSGQQTYNGQPHGFGRRFSARHNGYGDLAFADGHVESLQGTRVVDSSGKAIFPQADVVWTCDPKDDPNL